MTVCEAVVWPLQVSVNSKRPCSSQPLIFRCKVVAPAGKIFDSFCRLSPSSLFRRAISNAYWSNGSSFAGDAGGEVWGDISIADNLM